MLEKEVLILKEQVKKLDDKGFDLDAWKIYTINIIERIFGANSHKIEQLRELKYDFSSWSLRDTSGSDDSIKKKSRVILESAISELENFGLPPKSNERVNNKNENLMLVFENQLKGFQFKQLKEILQINDLEQKTTKLKHFFNEFDNKEIESLLIKLVLEI